MDGGETLYVGERLPPQAYYDPSALWSSVEGWLEQDSPQSSWWSCGDSSEAWPEEAWWNEEPDLSDLSPEEQKEVDEAFAVAEQKMRSFVQARQAVKARNLSRGFYPFSPHAKGGSFKTKKGKGKGKTKGSTSSSSTFLTEGFLGAAVGDPSYTGCFICGDKGHDFRSCPKRSAGKGTKGKKGGHVNFVDAMVYTVEEIPDEGACYPSFDDLDVPVPERELAGYAVIDSGATETVCSLPALEALVQLKEVQDGKPVGLEVTQEPVKRFKFGNGEHAYASSYVLLDQMLGERRIQLGMFTLDVEGVPVLLGMKTLRRLKAIIDFDRCLVVFAAINPHLAIGLRRSRTGHLLLNLTQDWLSQGVQLDQLGSELSLHPEILQAEIEENEALTAFMVAEHAEIPFSQGTLEVPADHQARACAVQLPCESAPGDVPPDTTCSASMPASCLKLTTVRGPQQVRSQTSSRMSTLKALFTFAALHGACCFDVPGGNRGELGTSTASGQGSPKREDQVQERGVSPPLEAERGEGPDLRGPRTTGPPCFGNHTPAPTYRGSPSGANQYGAWTA